MFREYYLSVHKTCRKSSGISVSSPVVSKCSLSFKAPADVDTLKKIRRLPETGKEAKGGTESSQK